MQTVSTCLWFDDQAQEAAAFYTSPFPNSRIIDLAAMQRAYRNA